MHCSLHLSQTNLKFITTFIARRHAYNRNRPIECDLSLSYFISAVIFLCNSTKRTHIQIHTNTRARSDCWQAGSQAHIHMYIIYNTYIFHLIQSCCFHLWSHWVIGRWVLHSYKQFSRKASLHQTEIVVFVFCFVFYDEIPIGKIV